MARVRGIKQPHPLGSMPSRSGVQQVTAATGAVTSATGAGVKISALPAAQAANDIDQLEVNQSGTTRRITIDQIVTQVVTQVGLFAPLSPLQFGAAMDGVTDDTAAFEALMLAAAASGQTINLGSGRARLSRQINVPPDVHVTYGNVTLDWSAVASAGSNFPDLACLFTTGDTPVETSNLNANVATGDQSITLTAADAAIVEGDVLMLWEPTDGSFSGFRTYYRQCEQCVVTSVSGATINLQAPLYASYASATANVYRCTRKTTSFTGGKLIIAGSAAVYGAVKWSYLTKPTVENIETYGADHEGFSIDNCYGVRGHNLRSRHFLTGGTTEYGMTLSHCQNARLYGVDLAGGRHGFTSGGGLEVPAVINRDFEVYGTFSNLAGNTGTVLSVFLHGNSEYYHISGQASGVTFGGNHGKFSGRIQAHAGDICAIALGEAVGLDFDCSGVVIEAPQANPVGPGIVEISGSSSNISANTRYGGTFRLNNMRVNAPLATRIVRANNGGYVGAERLIIDIRGLHIVACTVSASTVHVLTGSGTDSWYLLLDNMIAEAAAGFTVTAGTKCINPIGLAAPVALAAAATLNLDNRPAEQIIISGNTGITAITLAEGQERTLRFTGTPTITAGASLIIPGGTKVVTAGSMAIVRGYAAGVVQVVSYAVA